MDAKCKVDQTLTAPFPLVFNILLGVYVEESGEATNVEMTGDGRVFCAIDASNNYAMIDVVQVLGNIVPNGLCVVLNMFEKTRISV